MKLSLFGSFGFGNAGDEAVPLALGDMAEQLGMQMSFDVVTRFDRSALPNVLTTVDALGAWRSTLQAQPMIIAGGGIIEPGHGACLFRAMEVADGMHSTSISMLGVSVEPFVRFGWKSRVKLALALRRTGSVFTRDVLSERTLRGLIPWQRTRTIGDLVLWMSPAPDAAVSELELPANYLVCTLAPRWSGDEAWERWIAAELGEAAVQMGLPIVFLPLSSLYDDDRAQHSRVAALIRSSRPQAEVREISAVLDPRQVCRVIANSSLTISMRLHGCVMAYANQVPFVSIAYHPKLLGFSETVQRVQSVFPSKLPTSQTARVYGYGFHEFEAKAGDLLATIDRALAANGYDALHQLKATSLSALREQIARWRVH